MSIPIQFDENLQKILEEAVISVISDAAIQQGDTVSRAKSHDDELIQADVLADTIYKKVAQENNGIYLSEECKDTEISKFSGHDYSGRLIFIADPIDGSSEFIRAGKLHTPVTTALMVIRDKQLIAAAVGDMWAQEVYGLSLNDQGEPALCVRDIKENTSVFLKISEKKQNLMLKQAMVAAYAPSHSNSRIDLLNPLFDAAAYVHNNGGQPFALRVVAGEHERSYSVAMEIAPKELWEHIGPILASLGGASVCRVDGSPLLLDPTLRQTSITAANLHLAQEVQRVLEPIYSQLRVVHSEQITEWK